ncbi:MAG: amidohydrolase family protein [Planctomycetes bacterium]|nr:amidohydrolase family protein [Planctomycetota bacterium]
MQVIDAHSHMAGDDSLVLDLCAEFDVQHYNICVAFVGGDLNEQREMYARLAEQHPERYRWITSFDIPSHEDFLAPDAYAQRIKEQLDVDFSRGAIGCKIWKNVGMEIRCPEGHIVHSDHEIFTPIFSHLAACHKPLLAHLGEPYACWQPLDFESPHGGYFSRNPKWHMYGKKDVASHEDIMTAFDRVLERHPDMKCVGAHLGSLEYDLQKMAERFERFPNFAVDTGARNNDFAYLDREACREFFIAYADRILFGIDSALPLAEQQEAQYRQEVVDYYQQSMKEAQTFYGTDQACVMDGKATQGLDLPADVLQKIFKENAQVWYQTKDASHLQTV